VAVSDRGFRRASPKYHGGETARSDASSLAGDRIRAVFFEQV